MDRQTLPGDLPALWRERAETLRTYGDANSARLWEVYSELSGHFAFVVRRQYRRNDSASGTLAAMQTVVVRYPKRALAGIALFLTSSAWRLIGDASTVGFLVDVGQWLGGTNGMRMIETWGGTTAPIVGAILIVFALRRQPVGGRSDDQSLTPPVAELAMDSLGGTGESLSWYRVEHPKLKKERDELAAYKDAGTKEQELAEWEGRLTAMKDEMEPMILERNQYRDTAKTCYQLQAFGREVDTYPPLEALPLQVMVGSVSELLPSLEDMMREARIAWDVMSGDANAQANAHNGDSAVFELYIRVHNCEMNHAIAAVAGFKNCLMRGHDPRPWLVLVYVCYREWRQWIVRLTLMTGGPSLQLDGFAKWREAETTFWTELTKKLASSALQRVSQEIGAYEVQFGNPSKTSPMTAIPRARPVI